MKMEIEIMSSENIKPSSPTPQNLKNYKISLLDQIIPTIQFPIVLYFPTSPHDKSAEEFIYESTKTLKQSLSNLLTRYYPFAGRIKDHLSIDCNDKGFLFVVAKIKSNLSDFLKKPDQKDHCRLIPCRLEWSGSGPGSHVAMAQVNYFDCGGMAIGFVFSHQVADGVTMCSFIKSWSLYASGGGCTEAVCPNYIAQSFFPQNEGDHDYNSSMIRNLKFGKTILRRYVFDSRAISTLRAQSGDIIRPSRVELVSAFLWKCFTSVSKPAKKLSSITQLVNLRRRAQPPLPENCFGNFVWMAIATNEDDEEGTDQMVRKLRDAVSKIDGDFFMRMHGDDGISGYLKNIDEMKLAKYYNKDVAEIFFVSSWCNFGLYDVDFGWGKPIWLNNCSLKGNDSESPYMNYVWLIDTKKGDGIEAWVTLEEQYMRAFDDIEELTLLTSTDPSPLDI